MSQTVPAIDNPQPNVGTSAVFRAWADIRTHPIWILGNLILVAVSLGSDYLMRNTTTLFGEARVLLVIFLTGLVGSAVSTVLSTGYQAQYVRSLRGEKPKLAGMFNTFLSERLLILLGALTYVPTYGVWLYARSNLFIEGEAGVLARLAIFLPVYLLLLPIAFTNLLIVDQGDGLLRALKRSWGFTMKAPLRLIWVWVVASLASYAGILMCGFGILITLPILLLTPCVLYEENLQAGVL